MPYREPEFEKRHIGPSAEDVKEMLDIIGIDSVDSLMDETVPENIRENKSMNLGEPVAEYEYLKQIRDVANENQVFKSYLGQGYYDCIVPSVILRNILKIPDGILNILHTRQRFHREGSKLL